MSDRPVYIKDDTYNFFFDYNPATDEIDLVEGYSSLLYDAPVPVVDHDNPILNVAPDLPDVTMFFPPRPVFMDGFLEALDENIVLGIEMGYDPDAFLQEPAYMAQPLLAAGRTVGAVTDFGNVEMEPFPFDPQSIFAPLETYATWQMAWWREVLQNSVDAIKERERAQQEANDYSFGGKIQIDYDKQPDVTTVRIQDNGIGMTKNKLFNALLRFGGTGKRGKGATGGFGKAKELIFVPWLGYEIETVHWDVNRNLGVRTRTIGKHFDRQKMSSVEEEVVPEVSGPTSKLIGTTLTVYMGKETFEYEDFDTGEVVTRESDRRVALEEINPILAFSYVTNCQLVINGKKERLSQGPKLVNKLPGGSYQRAEESYNLPLGGRDPDWSGVGPPPEGRMSIYLDKKMKLKREDLTGVKQDMIPVRQNGLFMFYAFEQPAAVKGALRIECSGSALAIFTDNRDGLKSEWLLTNLIKRLEKDGVNGLKKNRDAFTTSTAGTDISIVENERIQEIRQRRWEESELSRSDKADKLLVDLDPSKNKKLEKDAEERRKVFLDGVGDLVDALESAKTATSGPVSPDAAVDSLGRANEGNILDALKALPQRVTGQQLYENTFWKPKIVLRSMKGPDLVQSEYYLRPNEWPKRYPFVLLDFWTECCRIAACAIGISLNEVSTGFIFDYEPDQGVRLAEYYRSPKHGHALLINPTDVEPVKDKSGEIVYTKFGEVKGFKHTQRYKLGNAQERERILASAIHEVTHLQGYMDHDWRFAAALTENMAMVYPKALRILTDVYKRSAAKWREINDMEKEYKAYMESIEPPLMGGDLKMRTGRKRKFNYVATNLSRDVGSIQHWTCEITAFVDSPDMVLRFDRITPATEDDYPGNPFFIELRRRVEGVEKSFGYDAYLFTKFQPKEGIPLTEPPQSKGYAYTYGGVMDFTDLQNKLNSYLGERAPEPPPEASRRYWRDYWRFAYEETDHPELMDLDFYELVE